MTPTPKMGTTSSTPRRSKSEQLISTGGRESGFLRQPKKSLSASFRLLRRSNSGQNDANKPPPAHQPLASSVTAPPNSKSPTNGKKSVDSSVEKANKKKSLARNSSTRSTSDRKMSKISTSSTSEPAASYVARNGESKLMISRQDSSIDKETIAFSDYTLSNSDDPRRLNNFRTVSISGRKKETKLSPAQRDLIKECWDTTKHTELGTRLYNRYFQKRPDIRKVFEDIERIKPEYSWKDESREFNIFLHALVDKMDDPEALALMSRDWGSRYVTLRDYGFKPSFWVPFSEVMTTECLYLDAGVHPVADMIGAWATLITIMLGHMRDGFYSQLRYLRRQSKRRQSAWTTVGLMPPDPSEGQLSNTPSVSEDIGAMQASGSQVSLTGATQHIGDQSSLGELIHSAMTETQNHSLHKHSQPQLIFTDHFHDQANVTLDPYQSISLHPEAGDNYVTSREVPEPQSQATLAAPIDFAPVPISPYFQEIYDTVPSEIAPLDQPSPKKRVDFMLDSQDRPESASPRDENPSVYHTPILTNRGFVADD